MKILNLIIVMVAGMTAVCFSSPASAAGGADLQAVVATLEKSYNELKDMQAEFSQTTLIASIKREERGSGEVSIKKPAGGTAMFRFDYRKPNQQIVSNGKTVWYYLPENNQVMVSDVARLFDGGKGVALNYLTGMGHVSRDFTISFAGSGRDKKGNYVLDLVPKRESQALAKLQLAIDAKAVERYKAEGKAEGQFPVVSSVVFDPLGNKTTIHYSKVRVNRGIGSERFNFKVPAGAEVIKN